MTIRELFLEAESKGLADKPLHCLYIDEASGFWRPLLVDGLSEINVSRKGWPRFYTEEEDTNDPVLRALDAVMLDSKAFFEIIGHMNFIPKKGERDEAALKACNVEGFKKAVSGK